MKRVTIDRNFVLALFLLGLFGVLFFRFFIIQVLEEEKWKGLAKKQHEVVVTEPHHRGIFYSNTHIKYDNVQDKVPFVVDVVKYHLFIDPKMMPDAVKTTIRDHIATLLGKKTDDLDLAKHFASKSRSRRIGIFLTSDEKEKIESWWNSFAQKHHLSKTLVYFGRDFQRMYPFGALLGQVLHTIRHDRNPKDASVIPTGGLEQYFDAILRGTDGKRVLLRSPRYKMNADIYEEKPKDGHDIYLTINHYLQAICEEELERGVKKAHAKGGWAVIMDPHTGEVLALGQYPFFDPTHYAAYYNDEKLIEHAKAKTVTDCFEPGSPMKVITLALGLLANQQRKTEGKSLLFSPEEKMETLPVVLPGRAAPIRDVRNHKFMNMNMAVQKSSNVYTAKVAARIIETMGPWWYRTQLENIFGFGKKTGVEIVGENPGYIPSPGKIHPSGLMEWSLPTPYSLSMGYNLMTNAVQMARAFSVIANGGYLVHPTIIKKVTKKNEDGEEEVFYRRRSRKKVLDEKICQQILHAMKYTTKVGGSARLAEIYGYSEAGKTGTSEKIVQGTYSKNVHFSSFVGILPANQPRFVIFIALDEPEKKWIQGYGMTHYGGKRPAEIFRGIGSRVLHYLDVPMDDPYGLPKNDPRFDEEKADWFRETRELMELYEKWNGKS